MLLLIENNTKFNTSIKYNDLHNLSWDSLDFRDLYLKLELKNTHVFTESQRNHRKGQRDLELFKKNF